MANRISALMATAVAALLVHSTALGVEVTGTIDQASGPSWQSAYIDLDPPRDFKKGERLVIRVEGSAEWVKVRLLPQNGKAEQPTGVVGSKIKIPAGGKLELTLREDRPRVKQISVHAGKEAWGEVINPKGGEVKILSVDLNP
jgi:hypothetical protein